MQLMTFFRETYLQDMKGASILDVGSFQCGPSPYPSYRDIFTSDYQYTGMDIVPGLNVDIVGYENIVRQYDIVISGQVMEHVKRPWDWLKSLYPYYSKYICIIAPHTWIEHKHPFDTYRYFPDGMRDLFEYAGIREILIKKSKNDTMGIGGK
jgi:hypothetical protein